MLGWAIFALFAPMDWWAVAGEPAGAGARSRVDRARIEPVAKSLTMVGLILAALGADYASPVTGAALVAGLVFGLAGDVLLLPVVDNFIGGLVAFFIGHVCYVVAMAPLAGAVPWWVAAVAALVVAAVGLVVPLLRSVAAHHRSMLGPVVAYAVVILVMFAVAVTTGRWIVILGALLFVASDRLLAEDRFGSRSTSRVAVHVLYHLGQAGLVVGLMG